MTFLCCKNLSRACNNFQVPGYGLSLALDIHRDMYHPDLVPPFDGVYVRLMTKYNPGGSGDGLLVKPGGWTKISLHPRRFKLINVDTGKVKQICIDNLDSIPYQILNHDTYSISSCKLDCAQRVSLEICDCVAPLELRYLKPEYHRKTCTFDKLKNCFFDYVMKNKTDEIIACSQSCATPCRYWEYTKTISTIDFTTVNFENHGRYTVVLQYLFFKKATNCLRWK